MTEVTGIFSEEPIFYVYVHKRNDTNEVFYVGKGKDKRAWSKSSRNNHWNNIVEKHGYTVEVLQTDLPEKEAFDLERDTIEYYGFDSLTNMTFGGHSTTGFRHSDETRLLQSEIATKRKDTNPEWFEQCQERMRVLNAKQKADPAFYKRLADVNKENYANLTEEGKKEYADKRSAWLKDEDKKRAAIAKAIKTRSTPEYSANVSVTLKKYWASISPEQRQLKADRSRANFDDADFVARLMESICTKVVVNKRVLFSSIKEFSKLVGHSNSLYSAMGTSEKLGYSFTLFKGCVIEEYNPFVHKDVVAYSKEIVLKQLPLQKLHYEKALVMDENKVFLSISEAARSFGDKLTDSTADWISRCMKNNKPAMGHNWRFACKAEIEKEVLQRIENLYENTE